jgi:predicted  nucleic acid-binding Zn-ribbon protein
MSPQLPPLGNALKILILPVLVIVVGAITASAMFSGQRQRITQLQQQLGMTQQQLAQLEGQNADLTKQLQTLQTDRSDLESRLTSIRTQMSSATMDLERSKAGLAEMQARYEEIVNERTELQNRLATVTAERAASMEQAARLEKEREDLTRSVNHWRGRLALLDRDYRKLAEKVEQLEAQPHPGVSILQSYGDAASVPATGSAPAAPSPLSAIAGAVELPPIVVRKDHAGVSVPVRGRVLEVNVPHNFVVVDKGSADGVYVGMVFDILRGGAPVGRATVVRARPHLAACDLVRARTPGPVQPGDQVVQAGP